MAALVVTEPSEGYPPGLHHGLRPDAGESVATLIVNPPPGVPVPPILSPPNEFLLLDKAKSPTPTKDHTFAAHSFSSPLNVAGYARIPAAADMPRRFTLKLHFEALDASRSALTFGGC